MQLRPATSWATYAAIFLGAFLAFAVEPVMAKLLLPWFGGSAVVWVTCLLFFQSALVAGYVVAYGASRALSPRAQACGFVALLALSLLALPIAPSAAWRPLDGQSPIARILVVLLRFVGAPYVLLTAAGPLLQTWSIALRPGRDPYALFALSNLGSLLGLLTFPFVIEPRWSSAEQTRAWGVAYVIVLALAAVVAVGRARATAETPLAATPAAPDEPALRWTTIAAWLAFPGCATLLLLAVTSHLTEDVASTPFLWVAPLSLYLVTFIVCFQAPRLYRRSVFFPSLAVALWVMGWVRWRGALELDVWPRIALACAGLFVACMVCHGEAWRLRPAPSRLAAFYLAIAVGGALGGVCVVVVAPMVLAYTAELHIGLVACAVLAAVTLVRDARGRGRAWAIGVSSVYVAGLTLYLGDTLVEALRGSRVAARNAYGSLREFDGHLKTGAGYRKMVHGTILHGFQWADPERHREPTAYFCPASGVGMAMLHHRADAPRTVGVVGLGVGTLAAYAKPGDHWRFYEINPLVVDLARRDFTFLADAAAPIVVVLGDGRLSLAREPRWRFDLLVLDAFAGDSIPVHLLTREAFALYLEHLAPDGLIAVHASNRNVDMAPVVADAAEVFHLAARRAESYDAISNAEYCLRATWILVARDAASFDLPPFAALPPVAPRAGFSGWTDDRSSVLSLLE